VSETLPHLKRGAVRDFESILGHPLSSDTRWNASDLIYTYDNGAKLEFFSADSPGKVLGPARKRLFLNECNHIAYETARQLFVRTTDLILTDYNPAASFWCNEEIEPRQECIVIHSTYKDNPFLTPEQVREIEANRGDRNWWKVYGLGEFGTLEGVIYSFDLIDEMPPADGLREVYGMDFGFTHDPTAIVRVLADTGRKIAYVDQRCYRTGMLNSDIARTLAEEDIPRHVHIWADAAEPKSIAEIGRDTGLNVRACDKSAPVTSSRLTFQLQWMQGWTLYFTKASVDMIKEARNYTWAKDRDGNMVNQPIDTWNHAMDAMRYALWSELSTNKGNYNIRFNR
jgi:phage terminase large subunit